VTCLQSVFKRCAALISPSPRFAPVLSCLSVIFCLASWNCTPTKLTATTSAAYYVLAGPARPVARQLAGLSSFNDMEGTDGSARHWKYVVDNVIVYRDGYRAFCNDSPTRATFEFDSKIRNFTDSPECHRDAASRGPVNRRQVLRRMDRAWRDFQDSHAGLSNEQMLEPGVTGAKAAGCDHVAKRSFCCHSFRRGQ